MSYYIKYEIKNNLGNFMSIGFGFFMPLFMSLLFFHVYKGQMPQEYVSDFGTQMYLTNILMIPMAMVFVGFAATFSQEIEQGVTKRLELFGYIYKKQIKAKFLSQLAVVATAVLLYSIIICVALPVRRPTIGSGIAYFVCVLAVMLVFFLLAYAIAMLTQKFSITYGITMVLYFGIMMLSGMMGVTPDQFPKAIRLIAEQLPTTQMVELFSKVWDTRIDNIAPLLQSFLLWYAVSGLLLFLALRKNRRRV